VRASVDGVVRVLDRAREWFAGARAPLALLRFRLVARVEARRRVFVAGIP
jgi:hypothetical protein